MTGVPGVAGVIFAVLDFEVRVLESDDNAGKGTSGTVVAIVVGLGRAVPAGGAGVVAEAAGGA